MKTKELINKLKSEAERDKERFLKSPKNKEMFEGSEDKPDDFKDKTFLYIRATTTDTGERPIPSGTVFWNSPDVELYDSTGVLIPTNQLDQNKDYTIQVKIHNDGDMSCNTCTVDLFICNPTIGFDRVHATQIGIQSISVMGHNTAIANFSFKPSASDIGHQCLFARAYSYVNGDLPNSGDAFHTRQDRHIGQQNLSVVAQGTQFEFMVAPAIHTDTARFKLKLRQNKQALKNYNIQALADLKTTKRTISARKFLVLKNTGAQDKAVNANERSAIRNINASGDTSINFFIRLIRIILSMFVKRKVDTSRYVEVKPMTENTWLFDYKKGENKVTLDIPYIFLLKNRATIFEIEMTNEETGESVGGLTIIVKG